MSRTIKGTKGPGYDYMSRRYGNKGCCSPPGNLTKRFTNRAERRIGKQVNYREQSE